MKLVTIQTKSAYESLIKNGYLVADSRFVNQLKYGVPYQYIIDHMSHIDNIYGAEFPIWAWVRYGKYIAPPKNKLLGFFPNGEDEIVKITFEKPDAEVLITDYIKYHFLLTNEYLPKSLEDKNAFDNLMQDKGVTKENLLAYIRRDKYSSFRQDQDFDFINKKIKASYQDILTTNGKYLQGTVWYISANQIKKVEIIKRENCTKKKTVDYRQMYIKSLK